MAERARDPGADSFRRAAALLDGLAGGGASHVVLSPGSRSTPLALAAARGEGLTLYVSPDERAGGFFALGLARATRLPAILVATSGSAPGHWLPAAIEAAEDDVPLVLVSADRPPELVGCGANQATDQSRLFGAHSRANFTLAADASPALARDLGRRVALACRWPWPGPVHVNAAFREPLVPARATDCPPWRSRCEPVPVPAGGVVEADALARAAAVFQGRRGVVLAGRLPTGDPAAAGAARLADLLGCPLVADPLSGLRAGSDGEEHLTTADALLRDGSLPAPEWCLRVGAPPVSRLLEEWAGRAARSLVVTRRAAWQDPARTAEYVLPGDPAATLAGLAAVVAERGLRAAPWPELAALQAAALEALARLDPAPAEAGLVTALARELPEGAALFLGNSLVVRDFDRFLPWREAALALYANRGVSGIDGNVASAAGIAAGLDRPMLAVVGDVALFHDLNALWLAARHGVVVLVINNGGGAIFAELPQAALPEFDRLWLTPTGLDLAAAAALFGLPFARHQDPSALAAVAAQHLARGEAALLELVVDREASARGRRAWWAACRAGRAPL